MNKLLTTLLLTLLLPATGFAYFINGNKLLTQCESKFTQLCTGYIVGLSDTYNNLVHWGFMEPHFCKPKAIIVSQLHKIVVKHLNENPEDLHSDGAGLVGRALFTAFPPSYKDDGTPYCPDKGQS